MFTFRDFYVMHQGDALRKLTAVRNKYGNGHDDEKLALLNAIRLGGLRSKKALRQFHDDLQFLVAYPDNKSIYTRANELLQQLQEFVSSNTAVSDKLFNTGVTGSALTSTFSFAMVKWLRQTRPDDIRLSYLVADDDRTQAILSVVMPKVESEILQDANAEWKGWLKRSRLKNETLLDQLINIFDASPIRPQVKEELWNALGINTEISFSSQSRLPDHLVEPFYHGSLMRHVKPNWLTSVLKQQRLSDNDAKQIIDCSRLTLIRNLREIDPISFTDSLLVTYYHLPRGLSVALMEMVPDRRQPIDSYMGYMAYKNGMPIAYAGSWILFDSARIGLNVFSGYRGGESQFIFQQVLNLHRSVYKMKRFSVDPYQIGRYNSDGIRSGAFWVYYKAGFRSLEKKQRELAQAEALRIKKEPGYRSPANVLKTLAESRMEMTMDDNAVRFDATDLSRVWSANLKERFDNRKKAGKESVNKLASILRIDEYEKPRMNFILENWCGLLLTDEKLLRDAALKQELKKLFELKAYGSEADYIREMQRAKELRRFLSVVANAETVPKASG